MARILTDETSLTRQRAALARESRLLKVITRVEIPLAAALLLAGAGVYFWKGASGWLTAGAIATFLCVGHLVKARENRKEEAIIQAGRAGEAAVTRLLGDRLGNECYVLNDLQVKQGADRAQIDHLVVSPRGLFVIETKNWRGRLEGDAGAPRWTQIKSNTKPLSVSNPILQSRKQVRALTRLLQTRRIDWPDVVPLVVLRSPETEVRVTGLSAPILRPAEIPDFIAGYRPRRPYAEPEVDTLVKLLMEFA
jgi:hypothetical protein